MSRTYGKAQDLIDFTRGSGGTALRRVKYGAELVTNGTFDSDTSGWTSGGGSLISVVAGELRVINPAYTSYGYAGQSIATEVGKVYQVSIHFNYIEANGLLRIGTVFGGDQILAETLTSGEEGLNSFSFVATTTTTYIRVGLSVNTADLEARFDNISVKEVTFDTSDGDLILFNHPNNIPRIEYDANGNLLGLLVEESRVNLVTYSDDMTQMANIGAEVLSNNGVAPDGTTTADFVYATSTGTDKRIYKSISMTSGATYTTSVYAKYAGKKYVRMYNPTIDQYATFDLINGVVETYTTDSAAIQDVGNGWYRCSLTDTAGAGTNYFYLQIGDEANSNNTTTGTSYGAYVWGAQLEAGSFPTSLIPTSGSTATRSADVASLSTSAFGYNDGASTIYLDISNMEYEEGGSKFPSFIRFDNAVNSNDRINIYLSESSGNIVAESLSNGSGQASITFGFATGGDVSNLKVAFALAENNFAVSDNGDSVLVDTSGTIVPSLPRSVASFGGKNGNYLNGHIKSIKYYPRRLTNDQLVEVTS